ncbi:hypothetical protein LLG95_06620 [bacterium]|nr:hypothetical protein [bacterium]
MKVRSGHAIIIGLLMTLAVGCAHNSSYLTDRYRDGLDIVTIQLGYGGGGKIRGGPIQTGLLMDVGVYAIRGGGLIGMNEFWPQGPYDAPPKQEWVLGLWGFELFEGSDIAELRCKSYDARQYLFFAIPSSPEILRDETREKKYPWFYYTQVEAVVGLIINLRVGVNVGEAADFVGGFMGFDLYSDDIGFDSRKPSIEPGETRSDR